MNYGLILAIVLVLYFFPDYTKHILLLSSLVLLFPNNVSLNPVAVTWIDNYSTLKNWLQRNGGVYPRKRRSVVDREENRLAKWVQKQRAQGQARLSLKVEGREGVSRSELLERLEGWAWRERERESWMSRYDGLVAWMSAHGGAWPRYLSHLGRLSSMSEADREEHRHAAWMHEQRGRGRACLSGKVEGREGVSRAELLERLEGWVWGEYESWLDRYDGLVAWMSAHGGAWPRYRGHLGRMSSMSAEDAEEQRHAVWVKTQRSERMKGRMQEIEKTSEGDISRGELFERLLRPLSIPSSRPIELSVDAILEEDTMKRRRIEEEEAQNIMRGWVMEERRSGQ